MENGDGKTEQRGGEGEIKGGGYACIKLRRKVVEMDIKGRMEGNEEGGREWRVKKARLGYTRFFFQRFPNLLNPSPSRAITHSEFLFLFLLLSSFFISEHEKLFLLLEAARFFFERAPPPYRARVAITFEKSSFPPLPLSPLYRPSALRKSRTPIFHTFIHTNNSSPVSSVPARIARYANRRAYTRNI